MGIYRERLDPERASADTRQLMAKERRNDDESGAGEVQITIDVVPGRSRAALRKLLADRRARTGLVRGGLVAAIAAGAIAVALSSGGRTGSAPDSGALATQFGLRSSCTRRTAASPDGAYARIDVDRSGPCGTFGYQVTLVLHRVHGTWVRDFEAATWRCPVKRIPQSVAIALRLCSPTSVSSRPAASPPRGVL
jgi:hypothetical protein